MEAIKRLLEEMKEENRQEMNQVLDACLGPPIQQPLEISLIAPSVAGAPSISGAPSVVGAQYAISISQTQQSSHVVHLQENTKKGCSFKSFMGCKPSEYKGSHDPKVTMKWITETNRVLRASGCLHDQKFIYASQMLRGQAVIW